MTSKVKARICFAGLVCALALLFTSCDFHIMSKREVEEYLKKRYSREFTVLSSESVTDDYYDDDVWRVKAYIVSPKDDPDTCFYAYNIVEGESFGVPGFRNSLHDTYAGDIIGAAFLEQAADTELEYKLDYTYPVKSSSEYHSYLWITFDPVFPEDLKEICEMLSRTFTDTLEKIPEAQDNHASTSIRIWYREHDWSDEKFCSIWIQPFAQYEWNEETGKNELIPFDTDADAIREYILDEVDEYKERLQQARS
ncbi:MAG: hypothetical protein K2N61_06650 [Lachnospiraceae bacterium]|nr:hypothetical protein [Lachnospiraceae bacterium]